MKGKFNQDTNISKKTLTFSLSNLSTKFCGGDHYADGGDACESCGGMRRKRSDNISAHIGNVLLLSDNTQPRCLPIYSHLYVSFHFQHTSEIDFIFINVVAQHTIGTGSQYPNVSKPRYILHLIILLHSRYKIFYSTFTPKSEIICDKNGLMTKHSNYTVSALCSLREQLEILEIYKNYG